MSEKHINDTIKNIINDDRLSLGFKMKAITHIQNMYKENSIETIEESCITENKQNRINNRFKILDL
jgi:uncharacterized protein (UPF0335 family)